MSQSSNPSDPPRPSPPALPDGTPDEATLLRLLVEAARDFAIFAVTPDGTILTWNPGVRNLIGYEEHEFIGQNCEMIFTPEDREQDAPEHEKATARRDGQAVDERWHLRKDGTRFWGSGFMHALYDANGDLKGFAKILRDMTAQKQYEQDLEARIQERTQAHQDVQRRLLTIQEDERRRISRELHDQTGQHLTALGLEIRLNEQATTASREATAAALQLAHGASRAARLAIEAAEVAAELAAQAGALPDAAERAQKAAETARTAAIASSDAGATAAAAAAAFAIIEKAAPGVARQRALADSLSRDIHRIAVDLRPTSLDDLGLVAALRAYCDGCAAARAGMTVLVESVGLEEDGDMAKRSPSDVETALYRIVQEALTNVAKYAAPAGATQVSITLQRVNGHVQVTIEDDGPGFAPETAGAGRLGLSGMRERAELLGGTLEIESSPGSGCTIYARVPERPGSS